MTHAGLPGEKAAWPLRREAADTQAPAGGVLGRLCPPGAPGVSGEGTLGLCRGVCPLHFFRCVWEALASLNEAATAAKESWRS